MQLWTLAGVAGPLLVIVAAQTVVAAAYILLVLFPTLGRDYQAAVLSGAQLDAYRDRLHVGYHAALRAGAERLHNPPSSFRLLH
jgi:Sodium/glutamate symporter